MRPSILIQAIQVMLTSGHQAVVNMIAVSGVKFSNAHLPNAGQKYTGWIDILPNMPCWWALIEMEVSPGHTKGSIRAATHQLV